MEAVTDAAESARLEYDVDTHDLAVMIASPTSREDSDQQILRHPSHTSTSPAANTVRNARHVSRKNSTKLPNGQDLPKEFVDEEKSVQSDSYSRAADINPSYTMTVVHSRRNANGTIGSVYSGNKIRHLKKEDGVPLWRKDIQFCFLQAVFEDRTPVFTGTDGTRGHSFADVYIDAMARSSKTSKILMQKLLTDRESALNMAMICLLVNVGRMNTTLNFFPEMRAQLRTYHSIPCLQAHQDPNANKQLQDAPRLKSILKGACEDSEQPNTIEKIEAAKIPRTNPVNLIFVLSQYAPKISETHFSQPRDFFDLVIRSTLSSRSRAKAFLWLIWWYLESDFSSRDAELNPFGAGLPSDEVGGLPLRVPLFEALTEEQANAENVDTEEEMAYGELKRLERKRILEEDETVGPPARRSFTRHLEGLEDNRASSPGRSDVDRTRSSSPTLWLPKPHGRSADPKKPNGYRNESISKVNRSELEKPHTPARLILRTNRADCRLQSSSPAPPASSYSTTHHQISSHNNQRRPRPETSHQKAVSRNRQLRIGNILHKKLTTLQRFVRRKKLREMRPGGYRAMSRIVNLSGTYDTEDEESWGPGGLVPNCDEEDRDFGGEALLQKKVLDRALRRLARGEGEPVRLRASTDNIQTEMQSANKNKSGWSEQHNPSGIARDRSFLGINGDVDEVLDDLDLDLLGEDRDGDHAEDELDEESEASSQEGSRAGERWIYEGTVEEPLQW